MAHLPLHAELFVVSFSLDLPPFSSSARVIPMVVLIFSSADLSRCVFLTLSFEVQSAIVLAYVGRQLRSAESGAPSLGSHLRRRVFRNSVPTLGGTPQRRD